VDVETVVADVEEFCRQFWIPVGHDMMYTSDVAVSVNVKSVRTVRKSELVVELRLDEVTVFEGVVLVGNGSMVGGCEGAPEKVGSG
jgi:hypothetical protein